MTDAKTTSTPAAGADAMPRGRSTGGGYRGGAGGGRGRSNFDRPKPEFDQKILAIRRVTRVVSGGRRMTFSVAMAIGDKKGAVGLGTGKAGDTALAISKALKNAKKNLIKIKTTKTMSIPHEVFAKRTSSRIMLMPNKGKGMVAGSAVRDILILAGLKDITAKIHSGSKNRLNNATATMAALALIAVKKGATVPVEVAPKPEIIAAVTKE